MWVKICANTCAEDALAAAELGADAVGFVFAPSARRVTAAQVREISLQMPSNVERVGVFAAESIDEIASAVEEAHLTGVQMHHGANPEGLDLSQRLRQRLGPEISIIQTVHWTVLTPGQNELLDANAASRAETQMAALAAMAGTSKVSQSRVLIDAKVGSASGGLGVSFDWAQARPVLQRHPGLRIIVAGGLKPGNVADAVRELRPWGVDVASGVEREPGRKDFEKLRAFIENARGA